MELKKNEKYDVHRKSGQFFTIGLAIALAFVILAFEWKAQYKIDIPKPVDTFEESFEIPITTIDAPRPPEPLLKEEIIEPKKPTTFEVQEVEAEVKKVVNEPVIPDTDFEKMVLSEPPAEEPDPPVFLDGSLEKKVGGMDAFYKHVKSEIVIPKQAQKMNVSGRVIVQFIVNEDGSVSDVQVLKGIGYGCDEEAKRVIESAPNFIPGKHRGRPVKVKMILPIVFTYSNSF